MEILIIEDEARTAKRLVNQIKQIQPNAEVVQILDSVKTSIKWLEANEHPELIFMDIHLADGSSFEIFKSVNIKTPIIFTTAYNEHAIDAFKANSIDYLLKPVKDKDLEKAFRKLGEMKEVFEGEPIDREELVKMIRGEVSPYQQRFLIRLHDQYKIFDVKDIAYFFIESRINFMKLKSGKSYPIDYSLDQLEEKLHPARFFRLNRQFTISYESIEKMFPYPKARIKLQLNPASHLEVMVSSEKSAAFKKWIKGGEKA